LNSTLFGDALKDVEKLSELDVESKLLLGELFRKNSKLNKSEILFTNLVNDHSISRSEWILASIGLIKCIREKGEIDDAMSLLETLYTKENTPYQKAYLDIVKGEFLSYQGKLKEALKLFTSSLGTYRRSGFPHLIALTHIHRGLTYFRMGEVELAKHEWNLSVKICNQGKCNCLKAYAYGNLADCFILEGQKDKALSLLKRSEKLMKDNQDLEGLAGIEFNKALFHISNDEIQKAGEHLLKSENIAFPFPYKEERIERRKVFMERLKLKGYDLEEKDYIDSL
jgi:tetratricopeptide (TPR) repeat protein